MSKNSSLEYTGLLNQSRNSDTANSVFNVNRINEQLDKQGRIYDHKLAYTNKTGSKTVIVTSARYLSEDQDENYDIDSLGYNFLSPTSGKKYVNQEIRQNMAFGALDSKLLHRLDNGSLLEFQAGYNSRINKFDSNLAGTSKAGVQSLSNIFGNKLTYISGDLYFKTSYRYRVKDYHFVAGIEAHQLMNRLREADTLSYESQTPFFLVPAVGLEWQISSTSRLTATYRYSFNNSGVNDIYNGYTFTDYRTITRGVGDFNQMNTSAFLINYRLGNWGDNFFLNSTIAYKYDRNFISSDNLIQPNYITQSKIVLGNRNLFNAMLTADRFIKPISSNIKAKFTFDGSEYKNRINSLDINTRSLIYNYGLEMRSAFRGFFNFNAGRSWSSSRIKSTFDNSFNNNMTFLDLDFIFKNNLSVRTQAEFYKFETMNAVNGQLFIDAELRYVYVHNKLTLFLTGKNLLNKKAYTELTNQDISVSTWQYRLVPLIINLKVDYRF